MVPKQKRSKASSNAKPPAPRSTRMYLCCSVVAVCCAGVFLNTQSMKMVNTMLLAKDQAADDQPGSLPSATTAKHEGFPAVQPALRQAGALPVAAAHNVTEYWNGQRHHLLFSTSCSAFQDWQSYLLYYQAHAIGQPGNIIRIASGCNPRQQAQLRKFHDKHIATMSPRYKILFTKFYGRGRDQRTKYWNKPFGMKRWLESALGYNESGSTNPNDDDIVILLDPDMVLLRPIVNDFSSEPNDFWISWYRTRADQITNKVQHGRPIAQSYGYAGEWLRPFRDHLNRIVGNESRVHNITDLGEAFRFYTCGPPYILTAKDMYSVTVLWAQYVAPMFDIVGNFMAEMYAYSMAAAHLGLIHQNALALMVSNPILKQEGWHMFDKDESLTDENACAVLSDVTKMVSHGKHRPYTIHYCQHFAFGEFAFFKYTLPGQTITSCQMPLFQLPEANIMQTTNYSRFTKDNYRRYKMSQEKDAFVARNHGYTLCSLLSVANRAGIDFRQKHCLAETVNYDQTWRYEYG